MNRVIYSLWTVELRRDAGELVIDLIGCFENVEKEVRKDHGLAASKKSKHKVKVDYDNFLAERRRFALQLWPYPRHPTEENVRNWRNGQLLRLLPGDTGSVAWRLTKENFYNAFMNLLLLEFEANGPEDADVAHIFSLFPIEL